VAERLGENPYRYILQLTAEVNKIVADQETETFGIRQVKDYFTTEGARGYSINGEKVLIKGAGWVDELFFGKDTRNNEAQVRYAKHMGLNTISSIQ
jgi:exo-1,4-beta-D-glucosaminidase